VARKPISTSARKAIWEAHSRKSAYSGEIIPWNELHIDHIIPVTDAAHLRRAVDRGIVGADFDVNSFENLLPAHNHHNSRKSDGDWTEGNLRFFLEIARMAKPKVEARLAQEVRSDSALKAYLELKATAERNEVSVDEMFTYVRHQAEGEVPLRITPGVDGADIAAANSSVAAILMDRRFALGKGTVTEVTLHSDSGGSVVVRTANEYLAAKDKGYHPFTTWEIIEASMAEETAQLLKAVRDSRYAYYSQIREPILTVSHLDRWHAEWATEAIWERDTRADLASLRTIADVVGAGICHIDMQGQWELHFHIDFGFSVVMRELLRADLDHDGQEEILIYHHMKARGGSLSSGRVMVAKMSDEGLLRQVPV
jgi:hypothetical protein